LSSRGGFTLIETLAALVIGLALVVGLGGLTERLAHHRITTDSNSAAMSLAERQVESLLAESVLNPTGTQCATVDTSKLCAGTHTATTLNSSGGTSNPEYRVQWTITDATGASTVPLVMPTPAGTPTTEAKQITVSVTHLNNPQVGASLTRYVRVY
jgi:prepilin-type N-terminal cleavage/methylation domain-containing protein